MLTTTTTHHYLSILFLEGFFLSNNCHSFCFQWNKKRARTMFRLFRDPRYFFSPRPARRCTIFCGQYTYLPTNPPTWRLTRLCYVHIWVWEKVGIGHGCLVCILGHEREISCACVFVCSIEAARHMVCVCVSYEGCVRRYRVSIYVWVW